VAQAGYEAYREDLKEDGIPEVFVKNGAGEYILINGYPTAQSEWPTRYEYYTDRPKREDRKAQPMKQWLRNSIGGTTYDPEDPRKVTYDNEPAWNAKARAKGYKALKAPNNRSTYQVFCSEVIEPMWNNYISLPAIKEHEHYQQIRKLFVKVRGAIWNNHIIARHYEGVLVMTQETC